MKSPFLSEILFDETREALAWMTEMGIDAPKIRYARYMDYIREFFTCKIPDSQNGLEKFEAATKSFKELMIINYIYHSFRNENQLGFIDRLRQAVTGQDHPVVGSAGTSRDYLFELSTASILSDAGYHIDFNTITDVIAKMNRVSYTSNAKDYLRKRNLRIISRPPASNLKEKQGIQKILFTG